MEIVLSQHFHKRYHKLPSKLQAKTKAALRMFAKNPFDRQLNNHALTGKWAGYRSINVTGDYRAIYLAVTDTLAKFYIVDTHNNLYN